MSSSVYRLLVDGRSLVVTVSTEGKHNRASLSIDGCAVASERTDEIGQVDLRSEAHAVHVRVSWWWTGRVAKVVLVERGGRRPLTMPFEPPAGTRAARSFARQQRHPGLYAARHVVSYIGGTLVGVVGVSFLLRVLFGWIDPPDIELPDVTPPAWLRWLNPMTYLRPVMSWIGDLLPDLPDLPSVPPWSKFVVGLVVASVISVREARRRRRRFDEHADQPEPDGADGGVTDASDQAGVDAHRRP